MTVFRGKGLTDFANIERMWNICAVEKARHMYITHWERSQERAIFTTRIRDASQDSGIRVRIVHSEQTELLASRSPRFDCIVG